MPRRQSFAERLLTERRKGRSLFSAMFSATWNSLGSFLNTYDAVDPRNAAMRGVIARPSTAADLTSSLPYVRNLCRNYERNNAAARALCEGFVANVVGGGIALEPDTGDEATDAKLREVWKDYIDTCFIDRTGLYEGQRQAAREVFTAGEALWRYVVDNERGDDIPLVVCPLEPEWLGDSGNVVVGQTEGYIGGVKVDQYGRPVEYTLNSPSGVAEKVPASVINHIFEKRRAIQFRGEPMMAPILTTLRQEKDLVTAELEAAKNTASFAAAITTNGGLPQELDEKGEPARDLKLGSILELQQGEDIKVINHTRPSQQIAPFRDMLRGDMAGACRVSTRFINRDISGANYSSMRADMLDAERLLAPVRDWFGHQTVGRLYQKVLPYLCIKAGVDLPKRNKYRLVPDGQPYVDPLKDAQAAAMAIAYGLSTWEAEIGKRGGDYRQVWEKLAQERQELDKLGIVVATPDGMLVGNEEAMALGADDSIGNGKDTKSAKPRGQPKAGGSAGSHGKAEERMTFDQFIRAMEVIRDQRQAPPAAPQQAPVTIKNELTMDGDTAQRMGEAIGRSIPKVDAPVVNVATAAPVITVQPSEVRIEAQPAPVVNITVPEQPAPVINVAAPVVNVENEVVVEQRPMKFTKDSAGNVTARPVEG